MDMSNHLIRYTTQSVLPLSPRSMIITTERLLYLWTIAETGSFSAAGRKLGLSAAAVQQAMQAFEYDLDAPLFERHSGKKPSLTQLGRQVYLQALDIIPRLESIEKQAIASKEGVEPQLRIALHGMTLLPRFQQALVALQQHFPTVELVLLDSEAAALHCDKIRLTSQPGIQPADITLSLSHMRSDHGGHAKTVDRIYWCIVAAPDHPLARIHGTLSDEDLQQYHQLFPQAGLSSTPELIEGIRCTSKLVYYSRFYQLRVMLLAGLGFGFYPKQLAEPMIAQGQLKALSVENDDGQMNWGVELCWVDGLGKAGQWLVNYLCEGEV